MEEVPGLSKLKCQKKKKKAAQRRKDRGIEEEGKFIFWVSLSLTAFGHPRLPGSWYLAHRNWWLTITAMLRFNSLERDDF